MSDHDDFLADSSFAAAFSNAYRGRHSPSDALWWLAHPLEDSPAGAPSPAASRQALKMAAFSREGNSAAEQLLAQLEIELRADIEDTTLALELARKADDSPTAESVAEPEDRKMVTVPPRHGWMTSVVAAIVIAALGVLAGFQIASGPRQGAASSAPSASNSFGLAQLENPEPTMLDVFEVSQDESDRLGFETDLLDGDSSRLITDGGEASTEFSDFAAYAARGPSGTNVCIVLVVHAESAPAHEWTCVDERQIPASGMSIAYVDDASAYEIVWNADGSAQATYGPSDDL